MAGGEEAAGDGAADKTADAGNQDAHGTREADSLCQVKRERQSGEFIDSETGRASPVSARLSKGLSTTPTHLCAWPVGRMCMRAEGNKARESGEAGNGKTARSERGGQRKRVDAAAPVAVGLHAGPRAVVGVGGGGGVGHIVDTHLPAQAAARALPRQPASQVALQVGVE